MSRISNKQDLQLIEEAQELKEPPEVPLGTKMPKPTLHHQVEDLHIESHIQVNIPMRNLQQSREDHPSLHPQNLKTTTLQTKIGPQALLKDQENRIKICKAPTLTYQTSTQSNTRPMLTTCSLKNTTLTFPIETIFTIF